MEKSAPSGPPGVVGQIGGHEREALVFMGAQGGADGGLAREVAHRRADLVAVREQPQDRVPPMNPEPPVTNTTPIGPPLTSSG